MIKVGINGYGTIGKRVAEAVTLQDDMEIVGIVKVVKEAFKDTTDKNKKFVAVKVKFERKFKNPVTLENIKKNKALKDLPLIKQSRLSVMPVDTKSWKIILNMGRIK